MTPRGGIVAMLAALWLAAPVAAEEPPGLGAGAAPTTLEFCFEETPALPWRSRQKAGLYFELLDEVAMPVEPADKALQAQSLTFGLWRQACEFCTGGLDHFAHAQDAVRQVGRQARTGVGRGQRRGNASTVAGAALLQKVMQHGFGPSPPAALALWGLERVQAQLGRCGQGPAAAWPDRGMNQ